MSKWELTREVQKRIDKATLRWVAKVVWVVVAPDGTRYQFPTRQKATDFRAARLREIAP